MVKNTLKYYRVVPTDLGCDAYGPDPCLICGRLTDERSVADSFKWVRHTLEPVDDDEVVAWQLDGKPMLADWLQGVLNRQTYGR